MSVNKQLGIILFSSFLIFATAPIASTQSYNQDSTKKQTSTQKGTVSKDAGKTAESDTQSTEKSAKPQAATKTTAKHNTGVSNDKVRQAQTALKKDGFNPGPVDGVMGTMTMTALRNYQSHNGLEVTGTINAETENSLLHATEGAEGGNSRSSLDRGKTEQHHPDLLKNQSTSTREALGLSSEPAVSDVEDVRQIQQALADLNYNPGDINGMMSSQTQQAIREFQWLNSLPVTGSITEQTKSAIDMQARGGTENAGFRANPYASDLGREKPGVSEQTQPAQSRPSSKTPSSSSSSSAVQNSAQSKDTKQETHSDRDSAKHESAKASDKKAPEKLDKDAAERAQKAGAVLQDLTAASDKKVPNEILQRAEAIAVIPNMIKGAFGIGGRFGKGVVAERAENGRWSAPAYIEIGGGSFGAQIGVSSTDLVLVFTDRKGLSMLEGGKDLKLGVDAGVVAGPIGRTAEAGVNANLESAIYAYSRAKGLFAGVALDGAVLSMDKDTNEKVYGASVDAKQILNGKVSANSTVRPFMDAVEKTVPKKKISQR